MDKIQDIVYSALVYEGFRVAMENRKRWHLFLILSVIALTIYNIFPTIFYYSKGLKEPVSEKMGKEIAAAAAERVNGLEEEAVSWLKSFCSLLNIKPVSLSVDEGSPQLLAVRFAKEEEAAKLRRYLPRAGSLIPFAPAQLMVADTSGDEASSVVIVKRNVSLHARADLFLFAEQGSKLYRDILLARASQIGVVLAGTSEPAALMSSLQKQGPESMPLEWMLKIASQIQSLQHIPKDSDLYKRIAASFTQGDGLDRNKAVDSLVTGLEYARKELAKDTSKEAGLDKKKATLTEAIKWLKSESGVLRHGLATQSPEEIEKVLSVSGSYAIGALNPYFSHLTIDWDNQKIRLALHPDLEVEQLSPQARQLLIDEIAKLAQLTNESFAKDSHGYAAAFHENPETKSILVFNLQEAAKSLSQQTISLLKNHWHPTHPDLSAEHFSIVDFAAYQTLAPEQQALCLVVYMPASADAPPAALRHDSIYCFAKGLQRIAQNYEKFPDSELAKSFQADLQALQKLLHQHGFSAYLTPSSALLEDLRSDLVFEQRNSFDPLLAATREEFVVKGTKKQPFLELSHQEQRILAENKIDTKIHEDLLKWNDEYRAATVSLDPALRYDVPKPTKNVFLSNLKLSMKKMFRGDEKKIIRWGLDLSGGKTLQIELRDANNLPVTSEADLKQGINELYDRVSKMGVSEVSIRQVGHQIVLDFPGSQAFSGAELVRASTMYFHIVNEKFSEQNPQLAEFTHRFLQEVWNEALVTGKKEEKSVHEIAWKHLYGDNPKKPEPRSEAGRILLENGLHLASPAEAIKTSSPDQTLSKVTLYRGLDPSEWHGQSHPLLIVFNNYALEGSSLDNIRASYDPSKGNFLSFDVLKSVAGREGQVKYPCKELQAWTSLFSKPKVAGTPLENYSRGHGWRMAVVLNDSVISCPTLNEPLQDSAMISGSFSQREVNALAADLKAGSLTFTPHILSEKNVSPELGKSDRAKGITATFIALFLVIGSMVLYYRFAGLIASIAVLFNILIMWATLQNLGATLSLAGIAGLILTVGMAVDANVLVFERIKEEFAATGRIGSAIVEGYRKAFSAILDSNVTTIIAALILLNFDAGPIKAFAITLIIGIASSMFTALFMTRFYFSRWIKNPKNTSLSMANWIHDSSFPFLHFSKICFAIAAIIIVIGGYVAIQQRSTLLGMDFTGGFAVNLELVPDDKGSYASRVEDALRAKGLNAQEIQVRELNPSHQLRVLLSTSLENPGKIFSDMPLENHLQDAVYLYQKNPRLQWTLDALQAQGLQIAPASLPQLHTEWSNMSGQMSDSMRNQALIGLLIAFAAIFFYIMFRFEYKFAIAAIVCLLHDVFITLGSMGLLHFFGAPIQIDLNTIAALMTIIGYSLNDTIIIFDRIREDMHPYEDAPPVPYASLPRLVNQALNATLSRTTITSTTTLLVLLALVCLGGSSVFSFALVMLIGVVFGTLSSWFIASPLMLYFHKREESKTERHEPLSP